MLNWRVSEEVLSKTLFVDPEVRRSVSRLAVIYPYRTVLVSSVPFPVFTVQHLPVSSIQFLQSTIQCPGFSLQCSTQLVSSIQFLYSTIQCPGFLPSIQYSVLSTTLCHYPVFSSCMALSSVQDSSPVSSIQFAVQYLAGIQYLVPVQHNLVSRIPPQYPVFRLQYLVVLCNHCIHFLNKPQRDPYAT